MEDDSTRSGPPGSHRQREAGAATRAETARLLVRSASELFGSQGYAATSVAAIAKHAGVALQTLYSAWGSKQALFRASLEYVLTDGQSIDETWPQRLQDRLREDTRSDSTDRGFARGLAAVMRARVESAGTFWLMFRNAAGGDTTIAEDWVKLSLLRHETTRTLLEAHPGAGDRVNPAWVDTAWVLASPEVYDLLTRMRGYDLDAYEGWLAATLQATLRTPDHAATEDPPTGQVDH